MSKKVAEIDISTGSFKINDSFADLLGTQPETNGFTDEALEGPVAFDIETNVDTDDENTTNDDDNSVENSIDKSTSSDENTTDTVDKDDDADSANKYVVKSIQI